MLEKILNKKIELYDRFSELYVAHEGVVVDYDDKFIFFEDGYLFAIKYIRKINIVE